jgi:hypothetical protein
MNISGYKGQKEILTGRVGLQSSVKDTNKDMKISELFFNTEFWEIQKLTQTIMQKNS